MEFDLRTEDARVATATLLELSDGDPVSALVVAAELAARQLQGFGYVAGATALLQAAAQHAAELVTGGDQPPGVMELDIAAVGASAPAAAAERRRAQSAKAGPRRAARAPRRQTMSGAPSAYATPAGTRPKKRQGLRAASAPRQRELRTTKAKAEAEAMEATQHQRGWADTCTWEGFGSSLPALAPSPPRGDVAASVTIPSWRPALSAPSPPRQDAAAARAAAATPATAPAAVPSHRRPASASAVTPVPRLALEKLRGHGSVKKSVVVPAAPEIPPPPPLDTAGRDAKIRVWLKGREHKAREREAAARRREQDSRKFVEEMRKGTRRRQRQLRRDEQERQAAVVIQAGMRRALARRQLWQRKLDKRRQLEQAQAVTLIAARWRGLIARRAVAPLLKEAREERAHLERVAAELRAIEADCARAKAMNDAAAEEDKESIPPETQVVSRMAGASKRLCAINPAELGAGLMTESPQTASKASPALRLPRRSTNPYSPSRINAQFKASAHEKASGRAARREGKRQADSQKAAAAARREEDAALQRQQMRLYLSR